MLTEVEKLAERYEKGGVLSTHVTWGPEGMLMSPEEQATVLNDLLDRSALDRANTVTIPVSQLVEIANALHALTTLGQMNFDEYIAMSLELRTLRRDVREIATFPAMFAEQWLPKDLQATRRKAHLAAMRERNGINDAN